jgi:lipopolysaccharide exporter
MNRGLARQAGSAIAWRMVQLAGVKVIFLVRTIILARLLAPDDFGLLAVSLIAVDVLKRVTNLGMVPALIQRTDADESQYSVAWTAGVVRSIIITLIVFLAAPLLASLFGDVRAINLIRTMAFQPLLEALGSIKVAEITRELRFRRLALMALPEALVTTVVSISLAGYLGVWALVIGILAGEMAYLIISYVMAPYRPRLAFNVVAARPLIQFGRWIFIIGIIALAGNALLQAVITRNLGADALGVYFLATRLAFIPGEVSGEVIGAVAFPLYARVQSDYYEVVQAFRAFYKGMLVLLMPVCLLLVSLAPTAVVHVLGPRWEGSIPLIQLLTLVSLISLLSDSIVPILQGLGQPRQLAFVELLQSSLLVLVVECLVDRFGVLSAGIAWMVSVSAAQLLSAVFLQRLLPKPFAGLGWPVLVILAVSSLGGFVAWAITQAAPSLVGLIAGGMVGSTLVAFLLWWLDRRLAFGLAGDLARAFPRLSGVLQQASAEG